MMLPLRGIANIAPPHIGAGLAQQAAAAAKRPRVAILGSGWAGYELARRLDPKKYERILISPRPYFVFTPLLASTTVATLEFQSVTESVHNLGLDDFHKGWADHVDFGRKTIRIEANVDDEDLSRGHQPLPATSRPEMAGKEERAGLQGMTKSNGVVAKGPVYEIDYDKLVVAVGAYSQTFGIEGVREHANFLRDVSDARKIRAKIGQLFQTAQMDVIPEALKKKLLHFVIVGGGPTGIEFAAELHDLLVGDMWSRYARVLRHVSITVYDVAPKVLPMFDQALAGYAMDLFARQGITVKTEHSLKRIRKSADGSLDLKVKAKDGEHNVGAGLVVWSTGLTQNPLINRLLQTNISSSAIEHGGSEAKQTLEEKVLRIRKQERSGSIVTDDHLRVQLAPFTPFTPHVSTQTEATPPTHNTATSITLPDVYCIGDCSSVTDQNLPATAQVASQQAIYLAKQLNKAVGQEGGGDGPPFKFRNWGTMAYVGGWRAIHQRGRDELKGRSAWLLWRTAYLTKSMSLRSKITVAFQWCMSALFGRDITKS